MKKLIVGLGIISLVSLSFTFSGNVKSNNKITNKNNGDASAEGIQFFEGTWAEATAKAEKENKLIFLDAYAEWCGPCKMMAKNTFPDKEVGEFFNKNFINFKMDMEKNADGPRLSRQFNLTAYPTLYFVNGKEKVVHQSLGYQKPKELLAVGQEAFAKVK